MACTVNPAHRAPRNGNHTLGYDTASEVLDGQGRGVSDDSESGVDGALESVKAASRELLPTVAGAVLRVMGSL